MDQPVYFDALSFLLYSARAMHAIVIIWLGKTVNTVISVYSFPEFFRRLDNILFCNIKASRACVNLSFPIIVFNEKMQNTFDRLILPHGYAFLSSRSLDTQKHQRSTS